MWQFADYWTSTPMKIVDLLFANLSKKVCRFAIYRLAHKRHLWICNNRISKRISGFVDKTNLRAPLIVCKYF
jgi:hypothetical protein